MAAGAAGVSAGSPVTCGAVLRQPEHPAPLSESHSKNNGNYGVSLPDRTSQGKAAAQSGDGAAGTAKPLG